MPSFCFSINEMIFFPDFKSKVANSPLQQYLLSLLINGNKKIKSYLLGDNNPKRPSFVDCPVQPLTERTNVRFFTSTIFPFSESTITMHDFK